MDQTMVKDREIIKDTSHCDMQKRIDEADLKITSVSRKSLFKLLNFRFFKNMILKIKDIYFIAAADDSAIGNRTRPL